MFWNYLLKGLCVGGWVIGFVVALGGFCLLAWGLVHLGVIAAGGKEDMDN